MSMETVVSILLLCITVISRLMKQRTDNQHLPPGPRSWPLVGNAWQLIGGAVSRVRDQLTEWSGEYGHVYSLWMFNTPCIVVSGDEQLQNFVKQNPAFCPYPDNSTRVSIRTMRKAINRLFESNAGSSMHSALKDVTCRFIRRLRCYGAIEVDLRSDLEEFTVKAAYAMLVGKMPLDDDVLLREMRTVEKLIRESRTGLGEQFDTLMLPWLRVIRHSTWKQTQTAKTKQECLWTRVFERGQDGYHPEKAPSCIVHAVTQLLDEESPYYDSSVKWADAKTVFLDVLMGGVRTATSDSSYSLLGFLANQPQALIRVQREIDTVLGDSHLATVSHADLMPYTLATIQDVLRPTSLASVWHTSNSTTLGEHKISAGTLIVCLPAVTTESASLRHSRTLTTREDDVSDIRQLGSNELNDIVNMQRSDLDDHDDCVFLPGVESESRLSISNRLAIWQLLVCLTSVVQAFNPSSDSVQSLTLNDNAEHAINWQQLPNKLKLVPRFSAPCFGCFCKRFSTHHV